MTVEPQDRFIEEADRLTPHNPTEVFTIEAPHCGPLGRPEMIEVFHRLAGR